MAVSVYTGAVDIPDAIDAWILTAKVNPAPHCSYNTNTPLHPFSISNDPRHLAPPIGTSDHFSQS